MLMIRLQRVGRKHEPVFRLVLTDSKNGPKSGKFLEILGNVDMRNDKPVIDSEKVKYWISKGTKVSDTVHNLLVENKIISGKKINVLPRKTVKKLEEEKIENSVETKEEKKEEVIEETPTEETKVE